jgi:hypothetical protein
LRLQNQKQVDVRYLVHCKTSYCDGYTYVPCNPATGVLFITDNNPNFISGHIRTRARDGGQYPYNYIEFINNVFGIDHNTIEVCSRNVHYNSALTVDINPDCDPILVANGEILEGVEDNTFTRWRCDPPYSERTAKEMYRTPLPNPGKLLKAGARVCKPNSLLFLLLSKVYQACPKGVKRIGMVAVSCVPLNEMRILNIFYKFV